MELQKLLTPSNVDFASVTPELNLQWLRFYYITGDDRFSNSILLRS